MLKRCERPGNLHHLVAWGGLQEKKNHRKKNPDSRPTYCRGLDSAGGWQKKVGWRTSPGSGRDKRGHSKPRDAKGRRRKTLEKKDDSLGARRIIEAKGVDHDKPCSTSPGKRWVSQRKK